MKIGQKIKDLRMKNSLTQEDLANRTELSKGFISQLENDLTSPSISTLLDILQCLGTTIKDFFADFDDEQVVFKKTDYFVKDDEEMKNEIKWIIPNAQKNIMEPILLTLRNQGRTFLDNPHEGEEFGYVLKGKIQIHLGSSKYIAKKGESFYFKAGKNHFLENLADSDSEIIWVSSPPSF